jgi:hypothetical protein
MLTGHEAIKEDAASHFEQFFKENNTPNLNEIINISSLYPKMVTEEEAPGLYKLVTFLELKAILEHFKKERSPGHDGWTSEFFIFFDLVGENLLQMVEDSRKKGKIYGSLNSTFLALIPKENNSASFNDYHPISLCNLIYKVISKVLANQIKPIL